MRRGGGVPARRAVVRWAWRMFRREWRQQSLILALLSLTVAGAVFGASAAYNVVSLPAADFGTANHNLYLSLSDPRRLPAEVNAARQWFGTVDVITRQFAPVPGSAEPLELRGQDPRGPYGTPMLQLTLGRYPVTATEVAVTDDVAASLRLGVGSALTLGGRTRTVVGLVENPVDLTDEFALLPPAQAGQAGEATILVNATRERIESFRRPDVAGSDNRWSIMSRGADDRSVAATFALVIATVVLLMVALVAAAGFVVVAQRRLRQLGMLAAVGATPKHLRLALLANGAVVGAVAAVIGTAAGLVGWISIAPRLETAVQHRIDRLDLPWWLVCAGIVLAVVTATGAAWWPARVIARIPITHSLSGRPPRPKPAHRSAVLALLLLVAGAVCLTTGIDSTKDRVNSVLIIAGTLATAFGVLLISSPAIRMLGRAGTRLPIAVRLALRDLSRYQARAGAALAAISLALGISAAVAVGATAAKYTADEGNLSDRQLLVRLGSSEEPFVPERAATDLANKQTQVDRFAATLDKASVVPLDVAVDPGVKETVAGKVVRPFAVLGRRVNANLSRDAGDLYVATPELIRHLGLDRAAAPDTDILTTRKGSLTIENVGRASGARPPVPRLEHIDIPSYSSAPTSFITPYGMRRGGWQPVRAGWLVETREPLTAEQRTTAREMAATAGLTVEVRREQRELAVLGSSATGAGLLFALGVLAMTVGLIRGEAAADLRTLTAVGATGATRRTLTATTTGTLALLGAIIGIAGAYLGMAAGYLDDIGAMSQVPVVHLTATALGLPLAAALAGWLLARREPPALTHQPME